MTVGEKIKIFRKEKGLTQKQLSQLSGIPLPTIQKYETGKFNPKVDAVKKIAAALDVPLLQFASVAGLAISELSENDKKLYVSLAEEAFKDIGQGISETELKRIQIKEKALESGITIVDDKEIHLHFGLCADSDDYSLDELESILEFIQFVKFKRNTPNKQ